MLSRIKSRFRKKNSGKEKLNHTNKERLKAMKAKELSEAKEWNLKKEIPKENNVVKEVVKTMKEWDLEEVKKQDSRNGKQKKGTPKNEALEKYDTIDEDIYTCFIANKTGIGENTGGTVEGFKKLESEIAKVCSYNDGKYYKSQAKSAKFAILFGASTRTLQGIEDLRQKGYKVTSLENALEYFGLTDLWDVGKLSELEEKVCRA